MAVIGVELETLVSEPDALTARPPPCADTFIRSVRTENEKNQIEVKELKQEGRKFVCADYKARSLKPICKLDREKR